MITIHDLAPIYFDVKSNQYLGISHQYKTIEDIPKNQQYHRILVNFMIETGLKRMHVGDFCYTLL